MLLPLEAATCIQMLMWERPSQPVLPCQHVRFAAGRQVPCILLEKQPQ